MHRLPAPDEAATDSAGSGLAAPGRRQVPAASNDRRGRPGPAACWITEASGASHALVSQAVMDSPGPEVSLEAEGGRFVARELRTPAQRVRPRMPVLHAGRGRRCSRRPPGKQRARGRARPGGWSTAYRPGDRPEPGKIMHSDPGLDLGAVA